jgi:hypothetical protein
MMRGLRRLSVALMVGFSLAVAATSTAQAVELKFLPEKSSFKLKSIGSVLLKTLGNKQITCLSLTGSGESHSERLGEMVLFFLDCLEVSLKIKCTGLSDTTTGNITISGEWHLRHLLSPDTEHFNVAILLSAVHFSCAGLLFTVNGCIASNDLTYLKSIWVAGTLAEQFGLSFAQTGGDPNVSSIDTDNSLGMEACTLLTKQEAGTSESTGLEGSSEVEKCEKGGLACTFLIDLSGMQ